MYITKKPITDVLQAAYELSKPQGLGMLHFQPGPLPSEELEKHTKLKGQKYWHFDYVKGRAVKLSCEKHGEYIILRSIKDDRWFDHTSDQAKELINRLEAEKWNDEQQQAAA